MTDPRHALTEPFETGLLDTPDGHRVHWERVGNPDGKPAVVLHGGPGSGAAAWWRRYFDPQRYCVTLFDQRGCGRSRPLAGEPGADLSTITTQHLIGDIESLRELHGVDRWLVLGGSWGSTLGLAYAVAHPDRVSEMVFWGAVTTTREEVDWLTWTMGEVYPEAFDALRSVVPHVERGGNLPAAVHALLMDPDPDVHRPAAAAWCDWEDRIAALTTGPVPNPRYADPQFALGFARLVTRFFGHHGFLPPDGISGHLDAIADIPAVFVRGRLDIAAPLGVVHRLVQRLPLAELHVVEGEDHSGAEGMDGLLVAATDRFAAGGDAALP
ncbi:alpha/beta fold hydrolase [Janibacter sp. CX7]|uniref:alpha/beta fold hydrolase n=1 Tax=Janibacter sp. CX7 TaxID=2963431 RepID=UPI0020CCED43|nr:alpha/beta fold hydrolase [Janibacter sp. CX7]UTT65499.1 alpha/beta fold hydrolase [Janibacter sp. CX7]